MRSRHAVVPLTIAALIALGGCTQPTFGESAEKFIEDDDDEVATALGITFDDASCTEPADKEVGTTFTCTAVGSDGETHDFVAEITARDAFTVLPSDLPAAGGDGAVPSEPTAPAATPSTAPATTATG